MCMFDEFLPHAHPRAHTHNHYHNRNPNHTPNRTVAKWLRKAWEAHTRYAFFVRTVTGHVLPLSERDLAALPDEVVYNLALHLLRPSLAVAVVAQLEYHERRGSMVPPFISRLLAYAPAHAMPGLRLRRKLTASTRLRPHATSCVVCLRAGGVGASGVLKQCARVTCLTAMHAACAASVEFQPVRAQPPAPHPPPTLAADEWLCPVCAGTSTHQVIARRRLQSEAATVVHTALEQRRTHAMHELAALIPESEQPAPDDIDEDQSPPPVDAWLHDADWCHMRDEQLAHALPAAYATVRVPGSTALGGVGIAGATGGGAAADEPYGFTAAGHFPTFRTTRSVSAASAAALVRYL